MARMARGEGVGGLAEAFPGGLGVVAGGEGFVVADEAEGGEALEMADEHVGGGGIFFGGPGAELRFYLGDQVFGGDALGVGAEGGEDGLFGAEAIGA